MQHLPQLHTASLAMGETLGMRLGGSGIARPMKPVGHKYDKCSLKPTTPPNRCHLFCKYYDLGWKVASKIMNLANLSVCF